MSIYNASISYAGRGEALVHITRFLSDTSDEDFGKEFFVSIHKKVGNGKEEKVQDWPGRAEDVDFVTLPSDRIEQNQRDGGLDLYLPPSLNDPLALDPGNGQYVLRVRFGPEGDIYECKMTMQAGINGEHFLVASDHQKPQQSEVRQSEKIRAEPVRTQSTKLSLNAEQRKKLLMLGGIGILCLLLLCFALLAPRDDHTKNQPPQPTKTQTVTAQQPASAQAEVKAQETKTDAVKSAEDKSPAIKSDGEPQPQTVAQGEAVKAQPCHLSGRESATDQELLSDCLKSGAQKDDLYAFAQEALQQGRCDLVKRILSSSGRAGHIPSALLLAGLYDPNEQNNNTCVQKNTEQARYWYQKAAAAGEKAISAQALEKLKNAP